MSSEPASLVAGQPYKVTIESRDSQGNENPVDDDIYTVVLAFGSEQLLTSE